MFSSPVSSGFKKEFSESNAEIFPLTETSPDVGVRLPVIIWSSVLFPAPFGPTIPTLSPS